MLSKSLKRFRSSFDIVQFSRSCLLSRSSLFIISGKCEFVKHFFDFSLSRSVEPLSFVTALLYYHAFHPLSTLFFNFPGSVVGVLVFRTLGKSWLQLNGEIRIALLSSNYAFFLYSIIHYIWERAYLIKGV